MENLVANALRFATEDVTITYRRDGESMVVEVCDDGPGIPAEQRELILRPFYRGEAAGDGKSGVGLGLAIVQRIVEMHGGRIGIEDAEIGGAKFVTRWPNAAPSGKDS
jgi:signal transduction histidine kinase